MKKLLMIILAVIMIAFSVGCDVVDNDRDDKDDKKTTNKAEGNYKEELLEILDGPRALPMEDFSGNVKATAYIHSGSTLPTKLSSLGSYKSDGKDKITSKAVLREDKELFSDANGKYVYVFFDFTTSTTGILIDCPYINVENGTLSATVSQLRRSIESNAEVGEYVVILKIEKDSFEGDISNFNIKIDRVAGNELVAKMLESDPSKLPMENFSGNAEAEAFIRYGRLPGAFSCISSDQDRYHKTDAIICDDKEVYGVAISEFVYVCFDFETTSTSYIIDCPYVNIENGALSVQISLTLEGNVFDTAMGEYTVVLKIAKASFEGDIETVDIVIGN